MWKAPPPAQEARPEFLDCRTVVSPGFPNLGSRQPSGESGLEVNRSVLWRRRRVLSRASSNRPPWGRFLLSCRCLQADTNSVPSSRYQSQGDLVGLSFQHAISAPSGRRARPSASRVPCFLDMNVDGIKSSTINQFQITAVCSEALFCLTGRTAPPGACVYVPSSLPGKRARWAGEAVRVHLCCAALLLSETAAAPRGKTRLLARGRGGGCFPRLSSADFRDLEADFRS